MGVRIYGVCMDACVQPMDMEECYTVHRCRSCQGNSHRYNTEQRPNPRRSTPIDSRSIFRARNLGERTRTPELYTLARKHLSL
ncbi:hypothetical protein WN55_10860 [Dufourea novaeangliae]|uniref:Uncharacterized protein n=1 Tax=Dufourea novaeangliae TaxID=178035 RepID=A0A154P9L9_DUFNO|nr:hypothetical protein WN55_10860 [Dufourea novaeangliae]